MNKIIIPQATVSDKEKLIEDYGQSITFNNTHLLLESSGRWKMWEEELGIEVEKEFWNKLMVEKTSNLLLELYRHAQSGNYLLQISNFRISFRSQQKADEIFNKIISWKFSN